MTIYKVWYFRSIFLTLTAYEFHSQAGVFVPSKWVYPKETSDYRNIQIAVFHLVLVHVSFKNL